MLLTMIFMFMMFGFIGRLIGFAFRFSWNIFKVALYLVFFPIMLTALVFGGLLYIAFPILIVAMIIGFIVKHA